MKKMLVNLIVYTYAAIVSALVVFLIFLIGIFVLGTIMGCSTPGEPCTPDDGSAYCEILLYGDHTK